MKKRLVWIGGILLALLLAAYLIVPNWILAKPREALIESVRQELAADWQSEAVAFVGEGRIQRRDGFVVHDRNAGEHTV
ncbi:MAG: hypothetical protein ACLR8U_12780 [Oscillospiraceae bacterium]